MRRVEKLRHTLSVTAMLRSGLRLVFQHWGIGTASRRRGQEWTCLPRAVLSGDCAAATACAQLCATLCCSTALSSYPTRFSLLVASCALTGWITWGGTLRSVRTDAACYGCAVRIWPHSWKTFGDVAFTPKEEYSTRDLILQWNVSMLQLLQLWSSDYSL